MHTSKIVEVDGVFIGAAVLLPESQGWRFVAADHRADAADGRTAATLHDAQQLAKRAFFTSRSRALAPATHQDNRRVGCVEMVGSFAAHPSDRNAHCANQGP
jgi:hypothetical protein